MDSREDGAGRGLEPLGVLGRRQVLGIVPAVVEFGDPAVEFFVDQLAHKRPQSLDERLPGDGLGPADHDVGGSSSSARRSPSVRSTLPGDRLRHIVEAGHAGRVTGDGRPVGGRVEPFEQLFERRVGQLLDLGAGQAGARPGSCCGQARPAA